MKDIYDIIKHAKFGDDRLRGSGVVAGQISAFPIDFAGRPYNTLTLPCERVISIPSPTHSFIPGLKPSSSGNFFHRSLSFSSSGLITWIPGILFTDTSEHIRFLLFSFSVSTF